MFKFIFSGVALAISAGVFFMYTQPAYDRAQALKQNVDQYNQALGKAAELQEVKQALLSRYNAFSPGDLARLQKLLPDHVDNVRLVLDLDNLAGQHSMALQNVVISDTRNDVKETTATGSIGAARQKFDSLTLRFSTRATYPLFVQFLEELESSLRIVDLVALSLTPSALLSDQGGEPVYSYDITLKTYWLK